MSPRIWIGLVEMKALFWLFCSLLFAIAIGCLFFPGAIQSFAVRAVRTGATGRSETLNAFVQSNAYIVTVRGIGLIVLIAAVFLALAAYRERLLIETMTITRYTRDRGPICYKLQVFSPASDAVKRLMSVRLQWYWDSSPRHPARNESTARKQTRLNSESLSAFVGDLEERDQDGYGRVILVVGLESTTSPLATGEALDEYLKEFSETESGSVQIAIFQPSDSSE